MIGNRAQRLIGRTLATAAIVGALVILVLIYARSGGKGGVGAVAISPSARRTAGSGGAASGGEGGGNGGSGESGGAAGKGGGEGSGGASAGSGGPPLASGSGGTSGPEGKPKGASGTFTGSTIETIYGPVQVAVSEEGGRIVDVKALQLPTEHAQSLFISERVEPMLREEALQAQGAEINIVSGATYTSEGFAQSLQAALSHVR